MQLMDENYSAGTGSSLKSKNSERIAVSAHNVCMYTYSEEKLPFWEGEGRMGVGGGLEEVAETEPIFSLKGQRS